MVGAGRVPRGTQNAQQFLENLVIMDKLPGAENEVNITPINHFVARHRKVVMKVVHLALHFLRTENGRDGLQNVLQRLITDWNRFGMVHIFPHSEDHTDANTRLQWVNLFLEQLENNHPEIRISPNDDMGGADAETTRLPWLNAGETIHAFNPRGSCRVSLNSMSIRSALGAADAAVNPGTSGEQRNKALTNWAHHIFIMSIALAHEYVHIFVGMFTGALDHEPP
ncbi:uncharacterized protein DNG_10079 [Cephalotrichum gorgonifer]|uniref:Uncharacterized protein n=1 Tax=Cephalotrichum gorgonifer TaxID=2041049 RepID=A0AAE8N6X4_9PEZI|nr:uncharacterized protein DNG_10079 [Cephalotrichum gorgonifer]